jgi:hypothetical protein
MFRLFEQQSIMCVCVCVRACVRACVCARARARVHACVCMHVCLKCLCENNFNTTLLPVKLSYVCLNLYCSIFLDFVVWLGTSLLSCMCGEPSHSVYLQIVYCLGRGGHSAHVHILHQNL